MTYLPLSCLGRTFLKILSRSLCIWSTNSGRNSWSGIAYKLCNWRSYSTGRTRVEQSRSGNTYLIRRRILFLCSIESENPFCSWSDYSRYSRELIVSPCCDNRRKLKSRTTQRKLGKYFWTSSGSVSSRSSDLIYNSFDKLMISWRLLRAFSSIVPMLL